MTESQRIWFLFWDCLWEGQSLFVDILLHTHPHTFTHMRQHSMLLPHRVMPPHPIVARGAIRITECRLINIYILYIHVLESRQYRHLHIIYTVHVVYLTFGMLYANLVLRFVVRAQHATYTTQRRT